MQKLADKPTTQTKTRKTTSRGAGEGTYYKDGDDFCWRLRVGPRGDQKTIGFARASTAAELKIKVRAEKARIEREGETKKVVDKSSVEHTLDVWFKTKIVPRRDQHTASTYRAQIIHIKEAIGTKKAASVGVEEAQALMRHYEAKGLGAWSALKGLQVLCSGLRLSKKQLVEDGLVVPKTPEGRDRVLSEEEFRDFLAELYREKAIVTRKCESRTVAVYRERHLLALCLNTGLRISEALGIVTMTVSLKTGILEVLHQLKWTLDGATGKSIKDPLTGRCAWHLDETKGDATRKVPLNDEATEIVRSQIAMVEDEKAALGKAYSDNGLLFPTGNGTPMREEHALKILKRIQAVLNAKREAEGLEPSLPYTIHDLRRTFGTYLAGAEDNIHIVSLILGHKDIETTRKYYTHAQENRLREAGAKITFGRKVS